MRALITLLFVLTAVPSWAEMTVSEIKELAFQKGVTNPHFYKIEYYGKTSYLLGTYHWGVHLDEFPIAIKTHFEEAENLIVEIKPTQSQLRQNQICVSDFNQCLIGLGANAPGSSLKPEYQQALSDFLDSDVLAHLNSYFEIHSPYLGWPALLTEGGSLDMSLIRRAFDQNKDVIALENAALRNAASQYAQSKAERRIQNPKLYDLAKDVYEGDLSWYEKQAQGLADYRAGRVTLNSESSYAIAYRNQAWMEALLDKLQSTNAYIAVGIGHLYGNKGLIRLLNERNIRVERVHFDER